MVEERIPGLRIIKDFISKEEEELLLQKINEGNWEDDLRRKVQQFGFRFQHKSHSIKEYLGPLPVWCADITQRLVDRDLFVEVPDQVIINHYVPGQGILPHVDSVECFQENIVSLGLGSSCIMQFTYGPPSFDRNCALFSEKSDQSSGDKGCYRCILRTSNRNSTIRSG